MINTSNAFTYYGSISIEDELADLPDYPIGAIVYDLSTCTEYVKVDSNVWEPIVAVENLQQEHKLKVTCPHCGASLPITAESAERGYVRCEYCRSMCSTIDYAW